MISSPEQSASRYFERTKGLFGAVITGKLTPDEQFMAPNIADRLVPKIAPIDSAQQARVVTATHQYIELAGKIFGRHFARIPINFGLTGRAAGMYHVHGTSRYIRYNPYLFAKYFDDNLRQTIPHEVAHYIADTLYGIKNIRPHGREWKTIMGQFGAEASIHCDYDLHGIPQRQHRRFVYRCNCRHHEITTRRHNMILRGERRYRCPLCKSDITHAMG